MEFEDGLIYKTPFVVWSEKTLLLYGSGSVLFVFDYKNCKLFKKLEYSKFNQHVRSIYVDKDSNLILVGFDNKDFHIYNDSFDLLLEKSFSKKISFIASVDKGVIVGDLFGDISFLSLNLNELDSNNKNGNEKVSENDCKIVVPFSHYSTITSSLIYNKLLFTGNKDGKIVANYLYDLYEIKDFYLSHKMSISYLEVVGDKLMLSLSIDNSIRFWDILTGLEKCRLLIKDSRCLLYHLSCNYMENQIFLLLLDEMLVIDFDFDQLKVLSYHLFKLPFVCQTLVLLNDELYLVDHYSNLYKVKSMNLFDKEKETKDMKEDLDQDSKDKSIKDRVRNEERKGVKEDGTREYNNSSNSYGFIKEGTNVIKLMEVIVDRNNSRLLETVMLYSNEDKDNAGVKINIKKHVDLD